MHGEWNKQVSEVESRGHGLWVRSGAPLLSRSSNHLLLFQPLSRIRLTCDPIDCSMPGSVLHYSPTLFKFMCIELVMLSNHLSSSVTPCPLFSICLRTRAFSSELNSSIRCQSIGTSAEHQSFQGIFRINILSSLAQKFDNTQFSGQPCFFQHSSWSNFTSTHNYWKNHQFQSSSVALSCPTYGPMDCSTPVPPVPHQLPELAKIHVH